MAEYVIGSPNERQRIGILPSAFNPPTVAHLALALTAKRHASLDQVVLALPRSLPHKTFVGASLKQRVEMLSALAVEELSLAVALTTGGLFVEIAREFRELATPTAELFLVCGKDAAERIINWDYGLGPSFDEQLEEFSLLIGDRSGSYEPPAALQGRVQPVTLPHQLSQVSSESLRSKRAEGEEWHSLTTPAVAQLIDDWQLYLS